jgi:glycosyltransferase involved in cell wall biosynthesis
MLIGTDRTLFTEGSVVRERLTRLAGRFEALDSIVFSRQRHGLTSKAELARGVHAHATNSYSRLFYVRDALRIARHLPRPDIISAQDPFETGLAAFLIARHFHVPLSIEVHTDFSSPAFARHSFLNRIRVGLARFVLARATGGYAVSKRVADRINRQYRLPVPMEVLPIQVDLARFRAVVRTPEKNHLLWIGRFEREKGPMLALESLAFVRRAGIDARLTMLGTGSLEEALKKRASQLGIEGYVSFPGWSDTAPYLARADLLIATSDYEGYGMAVVEALVAGVPVLSTDVGIAREAGATIVDGEYAGALRAWLDGPRASGVLKLHTYTSEEEYLTAVHDCYAVIASNS